MSHEVYCWADRLDNNVLATAFFHTTICVEFNNGIKYLFSYNDQGLNTTPAGNRRPERSHYQGRTTKSMSEVIQYAYHLQSTEYATYDVATRNCNHFSNDLSVWLCGEIIPAQYIMQGALAAPFKVFGVASGSSSSSKWS